VSGLAEARAHLAKAREFLDAAELSLEVDLYNAATSNSAISGINSKDATCLRLTGTTAKSENHSAAIAELKSAGAGGPNEPTTKQMATNLGRLLKLKGKSQYQTIDIARSDAMKAFSWAQKLLEDASGIVRE
jgi:uncharacterized protein (UPF0332 family)